MGLGEQTSRKRNFEFYPLRRAGLPELSPVRKDDPIRARWLIFDNDDDDDDEWSVWLQVLGEQRSLQVTVDRIREQLDEEQEARADLQRQLTRANNEAAVWRQKFESGEGGIRPEEMDELKKKLASRIQDGEAQLEAALAKVLGLEKAKNRSQMEAEALVAEVEKVCSPVAL